jgi:hypothetical protein
MLVSTAAVTVVLVVVAVAVVGSGSNELIILSEIRSSSHDEAAN